MDPSEDEGPGGVPWRALFERSPAMLGLVDLDGSITAINTTFAQALGSTPDDLLGRKLPDLAHDEDAAALTAALARAPVAGAEHRLADGAGGWRWLAWAAGAPDAAGRVALSAIDVTEDRTHREVLATGIAHDVRAPLRAIDGFAGLLLGDDALPELTGRYLALVRGAATELGEQVDGIVALLRVGAHAVRPATVDVAAVARAAAGDRLPVHADGLPPAIADPALLRRALDELVANAVKAGATRLDVTWDADARAYAVRDDGIGFDGERADRAFRAFGRLHDRERFSGAGVGLALVARIAERHGGRVWATSAPGAGTTIFLRLA